MKQWIGELQISERSGFRDRVTVFDGVKKLKGWSVGILANIEGINSFDLSRKRLFC